MTASSCLAGALLLVSCASSGSSATSTSLTTPTLTNSGGGQSPSATSAPGSYELTGFGATREAWDAHHQEAAGFYDGSAYLPMVGERRPYYNSILWEVWERNTIYDLDFGDGTTLEEAKDRILEEFPPGAAFDLTDSDDPRCLIMRIRSTEVEQQISDGKPMVHLYGKPGTKTLFSPSDVPHALLGTTLDREGTVNGGCV